MLHFNGAFASCSRSPGASAGEGVSGHVLREVIAEDGYAKYEIEDCGKTLKEGCNTIIPNN